MAGSFSQELEDLLNPLPKFADPEDDGDDTNKARVVDRFSEDDNDQEEDEDGLGPSSSALRKNNTLLLSDTDGRYVGKKVSRQQLLMDIEGSGEDEDEEEDDDDEDEKEEEEEEDVDGEEEGSIEELEEEEDDDDDEESTGDLEADAELSSKTRGAGESDVTFPKGVDFHTLTEGMDDLGVSGEEGSDSGEEEIEEGSDGDDVTDDDDDDEDDDEEAQEGSVLTFSRDKVDEEVLKGKAVKSQLALWDQLLEGRIRMQKALATSNQLPQPNTLQEFKSQGGAELAGEVKNARKALKALQRSLLELQDHLLEQNPDTRAMATGQAQGEDQEIDSDENEENMEEERVAAPKRKLEMAEYPDLMAKRFAAFQPYRNATLQKWHDKTRLTMGKSGKSFGAFDRNILTQVEQVLMDQERLLRRTQTRRSEYRVLGKPEASSALTSKAVCQEGEVEEGAEQQQQLKANSHLKDLDQDIFDDDDFYHQLLRELIERKTSTTDPNDQVAMGRQWLAIQKLRSKIKKKVDTKASKGRKVRFQIHSKLVNFMAPMDHSSMSDEARSELYRGLFGQNTTIRE